MRSLYRKNCPSCLKPFQTYDSEKSYCTDRCKTRHVLQSVEKQERQEPGTGEKACVNCNALFSPHARTQLYCNAVCSMAAEIKKRNGYHLIACRECERPFYPVIGSVKYCSESCLHASKKRKGTRRTIERRKQAIGNEAKPRRMSYEALNRMEEKKRLESL